jgi:hypothetical protein
MKTQILILIKDNIKKITLLFTFKNNQLKNWFYELQHGHKILFKEESDIICKIRFDNVVKTN